ncbi:hypothetical protein [Pseudonocardia acidicola]|uniref:Uncharacterized protein n=1 Tax=Pseudonocardia acidicola TaxID=2724939 RepID=A0ABX1SA37_9PSEU|nr:hypothetical protein [Pseudonocardia acidicola]NMH97965.1 hypothetical protein [Pseudonocardia acidicola]
MALCRLAAEFAAEIKQQDWSDAPYRADRAGHQRWMDGNNSTIPQLSESETDILKLNIVWNTAQVLAHQDPNFDVYEYAEACGVAARHIYTKSGRKSGGIINGLRQDEGGYHRPGTYSSALPEPPTA